MQLMPGRRAVGVRNSFSPAETSAVVSVLKLLSANVPRRVDLVMAVTTPARRRCQVWTPRTAISRNAELCKAHRRSIPPERSRTDCPANRSNHREENGMKDRAYVRQYLKSLFGEGKGLALRLAFSSCLALTLSGGTIMAQAGAEQPLTNAAVIKLVRAGFKEKTVIAIIHSGPRGSILRLSLIGEAKRVSEPLLR